MKENINLEVPMLKSAAGIFMDPSIIEGKIKNEVFDTYQKKYNNAIQAPTPNIRVPYSYVLTRAVPPEMKGYSESGLIVNQLQIDARMMDKLKIMSDNVSDEQQVLLVGEHVTEATVVPGEIVKINYQRYKTLNDNHTPGVIETSYDIPLYEIDGNEYLLIDSRDILYVVPIKK